jgi:hypothetical protein
MHNAAHGEAAAPEGAKLKRRVSEFVKVNEGVMPEPRALGRCRGLDGFGPSGHSAQGLGLRLGQREGVRLTFLAVYAQAK